MSTEKMVLLDEIKVKKVMKDNRIDEGAFSESLGHTKGWISKVLEKGSITLSNKLLIESIYHVDVTLDDSEELEEQDEQDEPTVNVVMDETNQWLCEIAEKIEESNNNKSIITKFDELVVVMNKLVDTLQRNDNRPKAYVKPRATMPSYMK